MLINKIIECLSNRHVGLRWSFLLLSSLSFFSSFSFFVTSTVHSATEHPKIFSLIFFKFPNLSYINNFFFFLIRKKDVYSRILPYAKTHKAKRKIQREKKENREKRKEKILITQERAKKHRERITRGESPSPRPVKQRATEGSQ